MPCLPANSISQGDSDGVLSLCGARVLICSFESRTSVAPLLTVRVTEYAPGELYTTTGFCSVELDGVPPGNNQLNVRALVLEVLVNCTVSGAQPDVGEAVNPAIGGVSITTVDVLVLVPQA